MSYFRKRPVVIEAVQFNGHNHGEVFNFMAVPSDNTKEFGGRLALNPLEAKLFIKTLEGEMAADAGDWIIKGVKGEHYPCKPDIFEATYERVEKP